MNVNEMLKGQQFAFPCGGSTIGHGLTKRELFAALAMHSILSDSGGDQPPSILVATLAVDYADMVLARLDKTKAGK